MLSALIFGPSRHLVFGVQRGCASVENLCVYKTLYAYPSIYEIVRFLNAFTPKIIFLEIEAAQTAFDLAREVRNSSPETVIIGFAQRCGREKALEALEAGISEILIPPFDEDDFHQAIIQVLDSGKAGPPENLFAFVPAKAGSGATTTALNVAGALARDWKKKILLVDGDLRAGVVSLLLNLNPERSVTDALEISNQLDHDHWTQLRSSAGGIDVLGAPRIPSSTAFSKLSYHRFFRFVRSQYDAVIVDLPEAATELTEAVVTQAKDFYIVTTPETASLFLARRKVLELRGIGVSRARISVAVNQHREDDPPLAEMEKFLERRITAVLPKDDTSVRRALRSGSVVDAASSLGSAIREFACTLAGCDLPPQPAEVPESPSFLDLLLGRAAPRRARAVSRGAA
jgi:Flp pilus assembly CpaE family ATPase